MAKVTKIYDQPTPVVGMGATSGCGSDRYSFTVVEILSHRKSDGKTNKIRLQADSYKNIGGDGTVREQEYVITPNPTGYCDVATLRKDGTWVLDGDPLKGGRRFWLGHRSVYRDPSF